MRRHGEYVYCPRINGDAFRRTVRACGVRDRPIAPRSPWQNGYVERVIGSLRRECLDHVIVWNEAHLRRLLAAYSDYYDASRTHLALGEDAPSGRAIERDGDIAAVPILGGLHHRYERRARTKDLSIR